MRRRFQLSEGFDDVKNIMVRIRVDLTGRIYLADILTSIRAIDGAITVFQDAPLEPAPGGKKMLNLNVKFEKLKGRSYDDFINEILAVEGVDMARLLTPEEMQKARAQKAKEKAQRKAAKSDGSELPPSEIEDTPPSPPVKKPSVPSASKPPPKKKISMGAKLVQDLVSEILKHGKYT